MFAKFLLPTLQKKAPYLNLETATSWSLTDDYETHDMGVNTLLCRHRSAPETWTTILGLFKNRSPGNMSYGICIGLAKIMGNCDFGYYDNEIPSDLRRDVRQKILEFGPIDFAKLLYHVEDDGFDRPSTGYNLISIFAGLPNSPQIILSVLKDLSFEQSIREKAAQLFEVYRCDPEWWSLWNKIYEAKATN
jgi:hypothetical protein